MELGDSPDPSMVPLPISPILGKSSKVDKVDRSCSPVWSTDVSLALSSSCRGGKEVATATSPTLVGGLTSAETSLMALLEGVIAEREAEKKLVGSGMNLIPSRKILSPLLGSRGRPQSL